MTERHTKHPIHVIIDGQTAWLYKMDLMAEFRIVLTLILRQFKLSNT